jgi:FkbH-like protein
MYRAEEKRTALMESGSADTVEFLRMCHLRMTMFVPQTEEELLRSFELAARTNQLNMSGNKYTPEEFDRVLGREGSTNFAFSCEDDFGTYGIVGFGQYRVEEKTLVFSEFAMSCRVAGKFVESALFTALLKREGCEKGSFTVKKTKKNILLRRTLEEIGFHTAHETQEQIEYHFDNRLVNSGLITVRARDIAQS